MPLSHNLVKCIEFLNRLSHFNQLKSNKPAALLVFFLSGSLLTSCSYLPYQAKPLDSQTITAKLINKDPSSPEFNAYLKSQGVTQLPIQSWGLNELTYCALFFNPSLDVAKAKWVAMQASINTANQRQIPSINGKLAHSNLKNGDRSPWAYGLGLDIPLETANKRQIRTELASYEAEIAHIEVAQVAWQLRSQIATQLIDYHESVALAALLQKELDTQTALLHMLDKRFKLGMLSSHEFNAAKLQQQKTLQALNAEQARSPALHTKLAASVGLTSEKFNTLHLMPLDLDVTLNKILAYNLNSAKKPNSLQSAALLNRLDIRAALARYAVAESKLKIEVAKQYPDISLSPSFAFEFGDSIWSLGISSLFNLFNQNTHLNSSLIAEATRLREVEAAQFEALQAKVIGDLSQAQAIYTATNSEIARTQTNLATQLQLDQQLQKQFDSGLIDRLELTSNQLITISAEQNLLNTKFRNLRAAYAIEDVMQHPLYNSTDYEP